MTARKVKFVSRRAVLAAAPAGVLAGAASRVTLAQPAAADPVSFYLGQVLALATLQAQAVRRLRPLLVSPNVTDGAWQAAASAEAGVIGAVASVLGAMDPPQALTASVAELRLAAEAYRGAADAASSAAGGDLAALDVAAARLAEGATHILLWLDALTVETGNDWGDGLRTLTEDSISVPVMDEAALAALAEPVPADPVDEPAPEEPAADERPNRQVQNRQNRQNRQNQQNQRNQQDEPAQETQPNRQNRQERQNRANREDRAAEE